MKKYILIGMVLMMMCSCVKHPDIYIKLSKEEAAAIPYQLGQTVSFLDQNGDTLGFQVTRDETYPYNGELYYNATWPELKAKTTQQKATHRELESTGKIHFKKRKELAERDAALIEEVNELQNERSMLMRELGLTDEEQISKKRTSIQPLETEADRQYGLSLDYSAQHEQAKQDYDAVEEESVEQGVDRKELWQRQHAIRLENTPHLHDRLKAQYGNDFDESRFDSAALDIRYYTQARHRAFSDYAKQLQRKNSRQMRDTVSRPHKKYSEPER